MGWVEEKALRILGDEKLSHRQQRGLLSHRFRLDRSESENLLKELKRSGRLK